ncbi:MAG: hypothetical protein R3277_07395 [Brumimicrobium sp.]|nr:hypothetical protein [Brumimicrobium sp.]
MLVYLLQIKKLIVSGFACFFLYVGMIFSQEMPEDTTYRIEIFSDKGGRVDWNAKTNKVALDQENNGRWDTYICNPDKSEMINLTEDLTGKTFGDQKVMEWQHRGQPAFHPEGNYILFQVMNEHASSKIKTPELLSLGVNNDLWIMRSDGTGKQKLTNNPKGFSVLHPHFSHDGSTIMWAEKYADNRRAGTFGAWRIKLAEINFEKDSVRLENIRCVEPVKNKWYESHGFSKDDTKIYFSGNLTTDLKANDIYSYDLQKKELVNLTQSNSTWEEMYHLNPEDSGIYSFISSRFFNWNNKFGWATLRTELYINDEGKVKRLTFFNEDRSQEDGLTKKHYFIGDHCWSPDGKSLLAVLAEVSFGETNSRIVRVFLE